MSKDKKTTKQFRVTTNYFNLDEKAKSAIAVIIGECLANEVLVDTKAKSLALGSVKTRIKT